MASVVEHPTARRLLDATRVDGDALRATVERVDGFLTRYGPHFVRSEQRANAAVIVRGKLSGLERKTVEPIAAEAGVRRRALQKFVGAGGWDAAAVRAELHAHVAPASGQPS